MCFNTKHEQRWNKFIQRCSEIIKQSFFFVVSHLRDGVQHSESHMRVVDVCWTHTKDGEEVREEPKIARSDDTFELINVDHKIEKYSNTEQILFRNGTKLFGNCRTQRKSVHFVCRLNWLDYRKTRQINNKYKQKL